MINVTKFFIDCKMTLHMYSKFDSHNSSQYWHHFENHPSQPLAGERHGLEGGRRVEAAFKAGEARERRLCSQVSLIFCLWWPFFLVSTGQSRQSWTQGSMSVLARRTLWVFRSLHHHHIHLLLHHDFSAHDFVVNWTNVTDTQTKTVAKVVEQQKEEVTIITKIVININWINADNCS